MIKLIATVTIVVAFILIQHAVNHYKAKAQ